MGGGESGERARPATAVSRRGLLRGALGLGAASAAGAAGTATDAASAQETVTIDMTDTLVFDPDDETVAPGTTVVWENVGQVGHSVTAYEDEIPEEAEFFASGGFDAEQAARSAYPEGDVPGGESFEHTFEVEGTYDYFCIPHEAVGMVAQITVTSEPQATAAPAGSILPDSAKTLVVAAVGAMTSVLGLTYFLLKYGGDYEDVE
jgi:plastocyanin